VKYPALPPSAPVLFQTGIPLRGACFFLTTAGHRTMTGESMAAAGML
jgi:hypothetical protein